MYTHDSSYTSADNSLAQVGGLSEVLIALHTVLVTNKFNNNYLLNPTPWGKPSNTDKMCTMFYPILKFNS